MPDGNGNTFFGIGVQDGEAVFPSTTVSVALETPKIQKAKEGTKKNTREVLESNNSGIGRVILYNESITVGTLGIIGKNPETGDVIYTIKDLGIGEIKAFNVASGFILGEKGISKVNIKTGEVISNTNDLEIGKISIQKDEIGLITGELGIAKFNIKTGEILLNTGNLGIGVIKEFIKDENQKIVYLVGEFGIAKVDFQANTIVFNTGNLKIGKIKNKSKVKENSKDMYLTGELGIAKIDIHTNSIVFNTGNLEIGEIHMGKNGFLNGREGIVKANLETGEIIFNTRDFGIGRIIYRGFQRGIFAGHKGVIFQVKSSNQIIKISKEDINLGNFLNLVGIDSENIATISCQKGIFRFNIESGEIIQNSEAKKYIPKEFT